MRRALVTVLGAAFALAVGAATATAAPGQLAGQSSASGQGAGALAGTWQGAPSNTAVGIRVLSPGDDGDVSQSNDASANAGAVNLNGTGQSTDQSQGSGAGTQVAGQENSSGQSAEAGALAVQEHPSNTDVGIRVLSPGDDGDVSQSNSADAGALAANGNLTGQSIDQTQGGATSVAPCGCETGGTQVAGQSNESEQSAEAGAAAVQEKPSNTAVGIRVLSPGDDGDVSQSNSADAGALAANGNLTGQSIDQSQGGTAAHAPVAAPVATPCGCQTGGTQVAGQSNASEQSAEAGAIAAQKHPSNTAVGIRVLSPGDDGDVSQSNDASAKAGAVNLNGTGQSIDQSQGGSGAGTQVAGQENSNGQSADAGAVAVQKHPSNTAVGIRVLSPGDDGDVSQSNSADAGALAANGNLTHQSIDQYQGGAPCGCETGGTQVAGQSNGSWQAAGGLAVAVQDKPSNTVVGIRVLSRGDDGDVSQSNSADAGALAANGNLTYQSIEQSQRGAPCGCGSAGTQVAGQENGSKQGALAVGVTAQERPSNTAAATRVGDSVGCGCDWRLSKITGSAAGDVSQSNTASTRVGALNFNATGQTIGQGGGGGGTQVAGQSNRNYQGAAAFGAALQFGAENRAT